MTKNYLLRIIKFDLFLSIQKGEFFLTKYYVRVSTSEQKIDRQLIAYPDADVIYIDKMSGKTKDRPQLKKMLDDLQIGDIVVVKSLDRLSRSTKDMLDIVEKIKFCGATLKILDMKFDTGSTLGEFFLTILSAISQLELKTIRERTAEGIAIAKANGKFKGRKKGSIKLKGDSLHRFIYFRKLGMNVTNLAKEFSVPRCTIYRWIKALKERKLL